MSNKLVLPHDHLSDWQFKNYSILADRLNEVDEDEFSMEEFSNGGDHHWDSDVSAICGSVACAIGHSIKFIPTEASDAYSWGGFSYSRYSDRVFGGRRTCWFWCFSNIWELHDNTIEGAINRIKYFTEGVEYPSLEADMEYYRDLILRIALI